MILCRNMNALSVLDSVKRCFEISDPDEKAACVRDICSDLERIEFQREFDFQCSNEPGRPEGIKTVAFESLPSRGLGTDEGHAAYVHAMAHIEFEAINLALDHIQRFPGMPQQYYKDWLKVAAEEAEHFIMLRDHLNDLGFSYGDFETHENLWELAEKTKSHVKDRMALVPRMAEARGLDAAPKMIHRLKVNGREKTAEILHQIYEDEISHVLCGSRWFHFICELEEKEPAEEFLLILNHHGFNSIRKPLNRDARLKAGFTEREMMMLESMPSR